MSKNSTKSIETIDYRTGAEPRAMAGDIPVFCSHDDLLPIGKIIPNPKNPNTHSNEQIKLLSEIIKSQGWRAPITVSTRSGFIVAGHGRLMAAQALEAEVAPVDYQNFSSEAEEYAALVADNRIAELADMDDMALADILSDIRASDIDMLLSGYTEEDMDALLEGLATDIIEQAEEEEEEEDIVDAPLSRAGDTWRLGIHSLEIGTGSAEELMVADTMIGTYIEATSNLSAYCVRDGEVLSYMDVVREWAIENGREDMLRTEKIPVIKPKKRK